MALIIGLYKTLGQHLGVMADTLKLSAEALESMINVWQGPSEIMNKF